MSDALHSPAWPGKFPADLELVPNRDALHCRLATRFAGVGAGEVRLPPAVRILSEWCEDLLARSEMLAGREQPVALPAAHARRLWSAAIAGDDDSLSPAECLGLAQAAMDAERLLGQWFPAGGPLPDAPLASARFRRWRAVMAPRREALGGCAPGWTLDRFTALLGAGEVPANCLPRTLRLAGFSETTAQEALLLRALEERGVVVHAAPAGVAVPGGRSEPRPAASPDAELRAAAAWAAAACAQSRRVAVVYNGLAAQRALVQRVFEDAFCASELLGYGRGVQAPFRVAGGAPMVEHPLVQSALLLLRLSLAGPRRQHAFADLSRWLLDPCWGGAADQRHARALVEHRLREEERHHCSLAQVGEVAQRLGASPLADAVAKMPRAGLSLPDWLRHWGWPGPQPLDAVDVQAVRRLREHLLAADLAGDTAEALGLLEDLCAQELLPDGGGALSPVQVLGPEAALAGSFDAVWLANFTDRNWPGPVARNALLTPAACLGVPRAEPAGQLAHARAVTARLLALAGEVVLSWAEAEQGVPQGPSPLFGLQGEAPGVSELRDSLARRTCPQAAGITGLRGHPWLRAHHDWRPVPVPAGADDWRGVVQLLELQSACPLAAFLVKRLAAVFLPSPPAFATPRYTGHLVHQALHRLYAGMLQGGPRPDPGQVPGAVEAAFGQAQAGQRLLPAQYAAELARIRQLLGQWLALESVLAGVRVERLEDELQGTLAGLKVRLRLDRADRLADGSLLVIDYKTGTVTTLRWGEERPGDLQLPLYAVMLAAAGVPTGGVALAQLRLDDCEVRGLCADPARRFSKVQDFSKTPFGFAGWPQALAAWSQRLGALAEEFRAGTCGHIEHFDAPLRHAGLDPLLRHTERLAWQEAHRDD